MTASTEERRIQGGVRSEEVHIDALLTDAGIVHIRSVRPTDAPALRDMYASVSDDTIYMRFFTMSRASVEEDIAALCRPPDDRHFVLVAELEGRIIGLATYETLDWDRTRAEVAFLVEDTQRGRGVGTLLFEHLAALALQNGVKTFIAEVLPENNPMLRMLRDIGLPRKARSLEGVVHFEIPLTMDETYRAAVDRREAAANARSLARVLSPKVVAVVGAGANPQGLGHQILVNIVQSGYRGQVFAVNRSGHRVAGVPAYASLADLPASPDVVIVAVPAAEVLAVARQAAQRHPAGLVVISAGFAEAGAEGAERQRELLAICRAAGMRLIGPNCMGIANIDPEISLNATFCATMPPPGGISLMSQSGAVGIAALNHAARSGVGLATFISAGNKADVSGNDVLCAWESDPRTRVCALYLESFGNPRKFARIARRVGKAKPIVAVKAGRTLAGIRGAASHTAAAATPDVVVDSLFAQAGVTRVDSLEDLFNVATFFDVAPLPAGRRVAIVGNSGGPGVLAADACEAAGLEVIQLGERTRTLLRSLLPEGAAVDNPVDVVASTETRVFEAALRVVAHDPEVDAVVVVFTEIRPGSIPETAKAIAKVSREYSGKPFVACLLGHLGIPDELTDRSGRLLVPVYAFPEPAVRALAAAERYARLRRRRPGTFPHFEDLDRESAAALVAATLGEHPEGTWLDTPAAVQLLTAYGITLAPTVAAKSSAEAVAAAERIGYPVVLKPAAGSFVHKTELHAVKLNLTSAEDVAAAFADIASRLDLGDTGVVVQPMLRGGVEAALGVVTDRTFGPVVMVGLGGVASDLLADRAFRLPPLTVEEADEQIRSLRTAPLLFGYRNAPPTKVEALRDMLLRLAELASALPEIAELDLNPVLVSPDGAVALDAKVRLAPAPHDDPLVRRLR
jgi:acyl-CoA synthetase (NDP forming)/GNAT superfamily N-acetyltransferase